MISKAKASYVRMSPQKIRLVIDLVRNKSVHQAYSILSRTTKRAAMPVKKVIASAVDAAVKNKNEQAEHLYISKITADGAGMMKRWRSMSMGRAGMIRKRISHINVELDLLPENIRRKITTGLQEQDNNQAVKSKTDKKMAGAA